MGQRDVRYSDYDANGNDNPKWKGKRVEMLKAVVSDPETTPEQKQRATTILGYLSRRAKKFAHLPELDQQAYAMSARIDASALWEWPERWEIVTEKGEECVRQIEPEVISASPEPESTPTELELEPEPQPEVDEPVLSGDEKLRLAKESTRGLL
jgi:hypothetical protein